MNCVQCFLCWGKKKFCDVFQPTALDFSHVLTNKDGVLLPEVSEERKCGGTSCCMKHIFLMLPALAAKWEVVTLNNHSPKCGISVLFYLDVKTEVLPAQS